MDTETKDKLFNLMASLCENVITQEQHHELEQMIVSSPDARRCYIEYLMLCASLRNILVNSIDDANASLASSISFKELIEKDLADASITSFLENSAGQEGKLFEEKYLQCRSGRKLNIWSLLMKFAAIIMICISIIWLDRLLIRQAMIQPTTQSYPVAKLIDQIGAQWDSSGIRPQTGDSLNCDYFKLNMGYARLEFTDGSMLAVEAPAAFTLKSSDRIFLHSGRLFCYVPDQGIGFTVGTPSSSMIDLGTTFGVSVNDGGDSELHVFQGEVVLYPGSDYSNKQSKQFVTTNQAFRVYRESVKVSPIVISHNFAANDFSRYELAVRKSNPLGYWHFDYDLPGICVNSSKLTDLNGAFNGQFTHVKGIAMRRNANNQALRFRDINSSLRMTGFIQFFPDEQQYSYTVSLWMKLDSVNELQNILSYERDEGVFGARILTLGPDGCLYNRYLAGDNMKPLSNPLKSGQWYFITLTLDESGVSTLYINGNEQIKSQENNWRKGVHQIVFGGIRRDKADRANSVSKINSGFTGVIDEVAIWDRVLRPNEIMDLYSKVVLY